MLDIARYSWDLTTVFACAASISNLLLSGKQANIRVCQCQSQVAAVMSSNAFAAGVRLAKLTPVRALTVSLASCLIMTVCAILKMPVSGIHLTVSVISLNLQTFTNSFSNTDLLQVLIKLLDYVESQNNVVYKPDHMCQCTVSVCLACETSGSA